MFFISKSSLLLLNHQILFWDILHCLFLCEIFPGGAGITITRWEIFRNFLVSCEIFIHIIYSVIFWDWLSCVRSFAGDVGIHTLCFLRYFQDVLLHCFCLCETCVIVMWAPIYSEIFWDFLSFWNVSQVMWAYMLTLSTFILTFFLKECYDYWGTAMVSVYVFILHMYAHIY